MSESAKHDPLKLANAQEALDRLAEVERQLNEAKEGLEHLQRLAGLGTLSAMVAHEFNNILAAIIGYSQMALSNPEDAELAQKALGKALSGAQRAERISTSLLGYAREEEGTAHASIKDAVDSVLSYLASGLARDQIRFEPELEDVAVAMPRVNLEQVLLNLMLNARKAMQKRGGCLKILAKTTQNTVHIELSDTGRGVPPQIADRLFEPFATHDPTPGPEGAKGSGLGLAICKDLVTRAGGTLRYESTQGRGTVFHIEVPRSNQLRRSA